MDVNSSRVSSQRFPYTKEMRLRRRREYLNLGQGSFKLKGQWLSVVIKKSSLETARLGITVSKQYGCAVKRNRFKRLVREVFRLHYAEIIGGVDLGFDIMVRPCFAAHQATFFDIQQEFVQLARACFKFLK